MDARNIPSPDLLAHMVQGLEMGLALVERKTWRILFENARFFRWFPPTGETDETLEKRLGGFDNARALERLQNGRGYSFEVETSGARAVQVEVDVHPVAEERRDIAVVECRDISKRKQTEYMLESYSRMAEKNTRDLQREKERVEKLLLNIMPRSVYEEMKNYGTATPQRFDHTSVLMLDFVGFTEMAISGEPGALITELNDIFTAFDRITELFGCERIKTIGDAYLAVSGLPEASPEHAHNVARAALRMRSYIERRNAAYPETWSCRIGIDSGPVIGSIVGVQKYVYDVFGPAVNLASRLESLSEPMQITLCENTYEQIQAEFACAERGQIEIKGFGTRTLYTLESELGSNR